MGALGGMDASEDLRAQRFLRITAIAVGSLAYWRLLFWGSAWDLRHLTRWFFFPTDPFPQMMILIAAALVYRRRKYLRSAMRFQGSPALAALPLLAGSSLFVWGHYVRAMDLVLVSFILVSIGAGLLWFGVRFARALAIPWVVLAFAYSAPAVITNQALYVVRLWTAAHTAALLQFVGIPVLQVGNVITGSKVIAQIIDSCSGLRSMQILTLAAIFYVSWFPARRLRQALLIILAPAIAYLFNLLRVGMIAVAPTSEFSTAHTAQGLMIFFGAIACLIVADRIFGRFLPGGPKIDSAPQQLEAEPRSQSDAEREPCAEAEPESATPSPGIASSKGRLGAVSLAVLAVTMLGISIWMPSWNAPESDRFNPAELPAELDGWAQTQQVEVDRLFLWTVSFPRHEYWIYERNNDRVSVFIGYDDRSKRSQSLLSRKNALPRRGWDVLERRSVSLESVEAGVERVVARSQSAQILTYHWYEGTDGWASEILRALLATDQSPFRRSQPARVIRVATALGSTPAAGMEDEARLRAFASSLVAALGE